MAGDNYSANLSDLDESGLPSSATDQLTRLGIDPTMARANPELLASLGAGGQGKWQSDLSAAQPPTPKATPGGPMAMPTGEPAINPAPAAQPPSVSATTAGKVGGAGDAPAAPAPAGEFEGFGKEGLGLLKTNLQNATDAAGQIQTTNPALEKLQTRAAALRTPGALFDPATGKRLEQTSEQIYDPATGEMKTVTVNPKPGAGQRIWRGVRGGLIGLMRNGIRGGILGAIDPAAEGSTAYGAPSTAYQKLDEQRQQQLAATDAGEKDVMDAWKEAQGASRAKAAELRANAGLGEHLVSGATSMEDADTKAKNEKRLEDDNSPEGKAAARKALIKQRYDDAIAAGKPEAEARDYSLDIKPERPEQPNEAVMQSIIRRQAIVDLTRSLGHAPSTDDEWERVANRIAQMSGKPKGGGKNAENENRAASIYADAAEEQKIFRSKYRQLPKTGRWRNTEKAHEDDEPISNEEFKMLADRIRTKANEKLAGMGYAINESGALIPPSGPVAAPAPAAAPAPSPSAAAAGALGGAGAPPPAKPMAAPDGTRRQAPDGSIEVKRAGQWVKE